MRRVARAAPDGYTVVFANSSTTTINLALHPNAGYEPLKEFVPVGMLASTSIGIIAHPSFPAKTIPELIALAKKEPGKLNIGTSVPGSGSYLAAEMFKARAGIDVSLVPYKGSAPAMADLLGGHVQLTFDNMLTVLPQVKAGALKMLAVSTGKRWPSVPDVPTLAESGVPGYDYSSWVGMLAPARTPGAIVNRLWNESAKAARSEEMRKKLEQQGSAGAAPAPAAPAASAAPK